jgi:hypothetical protein
MRKKPVAVYPYTNERGELLYEVCRYEEEMDGRKVKTFRQRQLDPDNRRADPDGYVIGRSLRNVLYRLLEVNAAVMEGRTVYLVNGEKDADALAALGLTATTCPASLNNWRGEHTALLAGARVVIVPDNYEADRVQAIRIAMQLGGIARSVMLLDLRDIIPTLPIHGDVSDILSIMGSSEGIQALLDATDNKAGVFK